MDRPALNYFAALALALLLGACSWLPTTESPAQRLAVVDAQFTAGVETATDLIRSGALGEIQKGKLTEIILRGNSALNSAWAALAAGQESDTQRYLAIATALLGQLRIYVEGGAP